MKRVHVALAAVLMSASLADAQESQPSSKQIFFDDRVVDAATAQVLTMDYPQLKALSIVLSACAGEADTSDIYVYQCHFAASQYDIEFGQDRPLDHLLFARNVIAEYQRASGRAHDVTPELGDTARRLVQIDYLLTRAMNLRFKALRLRPGGKD